MLKFNTCKYLKKTIERDELIFLVFDVLNFKKLLIPKINKCLILVIACVTTIHSFIFIVEKRQLHFGIDCLWVFRHILYKQRYVAMTSRVAKTLAKQINTWIESNLTEKKRKNKFTFWIQIENPACILVGEYWTG